MSFSCYAQTLVKSQQNVEEKQTKKLKLICRICNFQQAAQNPCVYTNNIKELEEAKNIAWTDVPYDPTLTRTYTTRCSKCNGKEAVFLQVLHKDRVTVYYVCATPGCGNRWTND